MPEVGLDFPTPLSEQVPAATAKHCSRPEAGHLSLRSIFRLLEKKMLRAFFSTLRFTEPLCFAKDGSRLTNNINKKQPQMGLIFIGAILRRNPNPFPKKSLKLRLGRLLLPSEHGVPTKPVLRGVRVPFVYLFPLVNFLAFPTAM